MNTIPNEPRFEEYGLNPSIYEKYKEEKPELESYKYHEKQTIKYSPKLDKFTEILNKELNIYKESISSSFFDVLLIFTYISIGTVFLPVYSLINLFKGEIFLPIIYGLFVFFVLKTSNENDKKIDKIRTINYQKINEEKIQIEERLEYIKSKVNKFEKDSVDYYENYLMNFHEENLHKKRSGGEEFEQPLSEFSSMISEVDKINEKLIFNQIDTYDYKKYLSNRIINHTQQKNNKKFFDSFENIKINQTESDDTNNNVKLLQDNADNDPNKKIKEEFRNKRKQEMSVGNVSHTENESESQEYNTGNIKQERVTIEDKTSMSDSEVDKNFLVDMFSIFNDEIDSANTSTLEDKKIINTVDIISPYKKYNTPRKIDWGDINKNKSITGMKGEEIAFEIEKEYLNSINKEDLAIKVRHVSKDEGDGHGYDILSFFPDGQEKYIEVKSSENTNSTTFKISSNELDFMKRNRDNYQVYRLFNVSNQTNELPTLKIDTANDILNFKKITPSQYIVKME